MPILGALLIAPVLPKIQAHFAGVPRAEFLTPIALTIPSLMIATLALFAGAIVDKLGRKRVLVVALVLYGVCGIAPIWLDSLQAIIVSRAGLGIAEAVIMTACTTMIGDLFFGATRTRYLALQTTWTSISAVAFLLIGGALGDLSWRAPFAVYGISLLLAPLIAMLLWEPARSGAAASFGEAHAHADTAQPLPFRPQLLLGICAITIFSSICFYLIPIHLAFLLDGMGLKTTRTIGLISGVTHVTVAVGTLLFRRLIVAKLTVPRLLSLAYAACGAGLVILIASGSLFGVTLGALLNGLGCGVLLPTLLTWNMNTLPAARRGLGTGAFTASFFLGNFLNPLLVLSLAARIGGRASAVNSFGWLLLSLALIMLALSLIKRAPQPEPAH